MPCGIGCVVYNFYYKLWWMEIWRNNLSLSYIVSIVCFFSYPDLIMSFDPFNKHCAFIMVLGLLKLISIRGYKYLLRIR